MTSGVGRRLRIWPRSWPARTALTLVIAAAGWGAFLLWISSNNRALCASPFTIASENALLRQGVWTHLLTEAAADRVVAHPGTPQSVNPNDAIDQLRVDAFLGRHPDCCRIYLPGNRNFLSMVIGRLTSPSIVLVFVQGDPTPGIIRSTTYRVDACSANVRKMS